ncbi:MAG TPA: T9SS type A sorting domain-containing protein [Ignavibacteriaceae bacterium]|nr:T9SS type A sorting domain-containing protein [Ignavibacteriaceae bacterium]
MRRLFSFLVILMMTVSNFGQNYFVETFDTNPVLSNVQAPNAWYPDRYRPAAFEKFVFGTENCLKLSISRDDAADRRPNGQTGTFYNTQGRKFDLGNALNSSVSVNIYIPADWATNHRRADIWGTMVDANGVASAYPIIGFANTTGTNPTFRVYNSSDGSWIDFAITSDKYGTWVNFKFEMNADGYKYYINNELVHSISNLENVKLNDIILQGYNFGDPMLTSDQQAFESYDIYFDNLEVVSKIWNSTQNKYYENLFTAINESVNGNTITLSNGTFKWNGTLRIDKGITLQGESRDGVILKPTGSSWGIQPDASGITLRNFTMDLDPTTQLGYPIHASSEVASTIHSNLLFENLTIKNAKKSGLDLNGISNSVINNMNVQGTTNGVGIALTDCQNITLSNLTTSGNAWGGVAIYTNGFHPGGSDNITLSGVNSLGETNSFYSEIANGIPVTNVHQTEYTHIINYGNYNFYKRTLAEAKLANLPYVINYYTKELATGNLYVYGTMKIADAVSNIEAGKNIFVDAGTFDGNFVVNKSVKIYGANKDIPYSGTRAAETIINGGGVSVQASDVEFNGLTFHNAPAAGNDLAAIWVNNGLFNNITVKNNIFIQNAVSPFAGRAFITDMNVNNQQLTIDGNKFTGWATGVYFQMDNNISVTNNLFEANNVGASNDNSSNETITNNIFKNNLYEQAACYNAENMVLNNNQFIGTVKSFENYSAAGTYPVNAENNDWGTDDATILATRILGNVDYTPWVGMPEVQPIVLGTPIVFNTIGTTATFNTLPAGTPGSLAIDRSTTQPSGTGTLPAGANPSLFLTIDAPGLTDHTFNVTIVLSTVGLTGFSSTTEVMYYEDGSGWVAVNGTFDATAQTYTFTTDHFTPFAFVNPTNPLAVYVTMNIANVNDNIWYNHNNADPTSDDWTYTSMPVTFYVLPVGNQGLFAADFKIKWDATKASFVSLEDGNLLSNTLKQTNIAGEVTVNAANLGSTINVTPDGQKYLAKITLNITKPGYNYVMLDNIDFRFYQNDEQTSVFATTTPGAVKMYLGDFVKDADTDVNTIGDGLVNQADLFAFAPAYWSVTAQPLFKTKFDVGPTNASGNYFAMPTPDGKIEFEDLAIFAIGYGKSANNQLPKKAEQNLLFAADAPVVNGQEIRVPITVSGNVVDLRALSMIFASNMQLVRVEKAGQLDNEMTFAAAKQENGIITFDAAVIGEQQSVNANGVIAYLVLRGQGSVSIANVIARDSYNNAIVSKANGNAVGTVPVEFSLTQNYPNPFNPSTTISYAVAKAGLVEVAIYNSLGEKVAQLVNQVQEAGNYTVEFNASRLSSGVYFYQMTAGDFSSIKKMVLMK